MLNTEAFRFTITGSWITIDGSRLHFLCNEKRKVIAHEINPIRHFKRFGTIREYTRGEGGIVVMSNGKKMEVSRRKKEAFITRMKEFYKY